MKEKKQDYIDAYHVLYYGLNLSDKTVKEIVEKINKKFPDKNKISKDLQNG